LSVSVSVGVLGGCAQPDKEAEVVRQYAALMYANWTEIVTRAQALQSAVDTFVDEPSDANYQAARQAWLATRASYGESEIGRFYRGPIDSLQGRINEWPVDENFIDYTAGNPNNGIINRVRDVPEISPQVLSYYTGFQGADNLALGYHAIEFLLWGQRTNQTQGPGQRPYTDYVDGGTAQNQGRRRDYLRIATMLLVGDLSTVAAQWDLGDPMSYATQLTARPPKDALTDIVRGQTGMAISELLYERINDPFITRDQKDELSCFSESTLADLQANALGVENVYLGRYHDVQGPGLADLVAAQDPDFDARMRQLLQAGQKALAAIPPPFDHAVLAADDAAPRMRVQEAIGAFMELAAAFPQMAKTLGIPINLQ
jgi:putative iron-regulated protein